MRVWLALLPLVLEGGDADQGREAFEASGIARRGDSVVFVDDGVPGVVFSVPIFASHGATRIESDAAAEPLPGARLASDLEGIAVVQGDTLVLSEDLAAVIDAHGARYFFDPLQHETLGRGLEGLDVRPGEGDLVGVATFEGGYANPRATPIELRAMLRARPLDPLLIRFTLPSAGSSTHQGDDPSATVVPLAVGRIEHPAARRWRFRAPDLVWQVGADGTADVIVLLSSMPGPDDAPGTFAECWLQRFDLDGRPLGTPFDVRAHCREQHDEALAGANWEGLAWWEPGQTLVLVNDAGGSGDTWALFVQLPEGWDTRLEAPDPVDSLHASALVFDGHNDLAWALRERGGSLDANDIAQPQPELHTDIPRLTRGGLGAQFWSVYVPAETARTGEAARQTLEQIELVHRMLRRYPAVFELAESAADVERIHRAGRIASLLGIEGGHSIENSLQLLSVYRELGVRTMTLTHADTIEWADSATDAPQHGGLTAFGEDVVREMNRLGMLVDLSHVSAETMVDALRVSTAPVIFTHSSAYGVAAHARNVPDDVLELVAENGGVVMVNFFSGFVVPSSAEAMASIFDVRRELRERFADDEEGYQAALATWQAEHPLDPGDVRNVIDHIDHIARVAGIDHVGLGSDYDGVTLLPRGLEDVSTYPAITRELVRRGYSHEDVRKVLGLNALRALREAEAVARTASRR